MCQAQVKICILFYCFVQKLECMVVLGCISAYGMASLHIWREAINILSNICCHPINTFLGKALNIAGIET